MVQINFAQKEIQCKIVYYGPGMSGKTTNLELVHSKVPEESRGELTSIATTGERTLYFDYMPLDLGQIAGIRTKFQLYTVPGQIYYKSTRRLVLQGVDGIVFVADSSKAKIAENKESMADLEENLRDMGKSLTDVPIVIQYNKRDIPDAMSIEELQQQVNVHGFPHFEAVANKGDGVFPTLKDLAGRVLESVNSGGLVGSRAKAAAAAPATAAVAAPASAAARAVGTPARAPATAGTGAPSAARPAASAAPAAARPSAPARPSAAPAGVGKSAAAPAAGRSATAVAGGPPPRGPSGVHARPGAAPPRPEAPGWQGAQAPAAAAAPAANGYTPSTRSMQDRMVSMSGLANDGRRSKLMLFVGLAGLIGAAAWFVLSRI
jgi:signal recognition particle receptor subunit beta